MRAKLAIGAALMSLAAPAGAEDWDFVLVNKTGKTIKTVEVTDAGQAQWAKEKLEDDVQNGPIRPGESHTVHFAKNTCKIDVRLTFSDDSQSVFSNFNACDNAFGDFAFKGEIPVVKGS